MLSPWKRAKARERNAGYREGYAAGLRDAQRIAGAYVRDDGLKDPDVVELSERLEGHARTAQRAADAAGRS